MKKILKKKKFSVILNNNILISKMKLKFKSITFSKLLKIKITLLQGNILDNSRFKV
jgi:hypothetical protein